MHYITPDIINQINTETGTDVENLWNNCIDSFMNHCARVRDYLPKNVVDFTETYDFMNHTCFCRSTNFFRDEYAFVIGNSAEKEIFMLSYDIPEGVSPCVDSYEGRGFSQSEISIWLYDEFHYKKTYYEHHIIFSDGLSYVIPFKNFYYRKTPWFLESGD